jgi:hypothetical protein
MKSATAVAEKADPAIRSPMSFSSIEVSQTSRGTASASASRRWMGRAWLRERLSITTRRRSRSSFSFLKRSPSAMAVLSRALSFSTRAISARSAPASPSSTYQYPPTAAAARR